MGQQQGASGLQIADDAQQKMQCPDQGGHILALLVLTAHRLACQQRQGVCGLNLTVELLNAEMMLAFRKHQADNTEVAAAPLKLISLGNQAVAGRSTPAAILLLNADFSLGNEDHRNGAIALELFLAARPLQRNQIKARQAEFKGRVQLRGSASVWCLKGDGWPVSVWTRWYQFEETWLEMRMKRISLAK
jgi:hypothetical protein